MRVLITSASTPPALSLARLLSAEGHTVIAADTEHLLFTSPARFSRAYSRFYRIRRQYSIFCVQEQWRSILSDIDLVIPFGPPPNILSTIAGELGIQVIYSVLFLSDDIFQVFVRERVAQDNCFIKVPLAFDIQTVDQIYESLAMFNPSIIWELKPTPYDDYDGETLVESSPTSCLPQSYCPGWTSTKETTTISTLSLTKHLIRAVNALPISPSRPWRLTELIRCGTQYSAHCFINNTEIQSFIVTTPHDNGLAREDDFTVVPPSDPLVAALFHFIVRFIHEYTLYIREKGGWVDFDHQSAKRKDSHANGISTHMTMTFTVHDRSSTTELSRTITVLTCSSTPHLALSLLANTPSKRSAIAKAYTSPTNHSSSCTPTILPDDTPNPRGFYYFPAVVAEGWSTVRDFRIRDRQWWREVAQFVMMCWVWGLCFWEEWWDWKDPGPAIVEWGVRRTGERLVAWLKG